MSKYASAPTASAFFTALSDQARRALSERGEAVAEWLAKAEGAAKEQWPELVPGCGRRAESYARYLAAKVGALDTPQFFEQLRTTDLYLACACAERDTGALTLFESRYYPLVDRVLRRLKIPASAAEEIKAQLREELFFASTGTAPLIENYSGRGDLGGWVHVIAMRTAMRSVRKEKRNVTIDIEFQKVAGDDIELAYMKKLAAAEFKDALRSAVQTLSDRQRNLLRQHFVDGLTIDALGRLYRVHRATAARWLAEAREEVLSAVRAHLAQKLSLTGAELDSVVRMARSNLDVSLSSLLGARQSALGRGGRGRRQRE